MKASCKTDHLDWVYITVLLTSERPISIISSQPVAWAPGPSCRSGVRARSKQLHIMLPVATYGHLPIQTPNTVAKCNYADCNMTEPYRAQGSGSALHSFDFKARRCGMDHKCHNFGAKGRSSMS